MLNECLNLQIIAPPRSFLIKTLIKIFHISTTQINSERLLRDSVLSDKYLPSRCIFKKKALHKFLIIKIQGFKKGMYIKLLTWIFKLAVSGIELKQWSVIAFC